MKIIEVVYLCWPIWTVLNMASFVLVIITGFKSFLSGLNATKSLPGSKDWQKDITESKKLSLSILCWIVTFVLLLVAISCHVYILFK